MEPGAQLGPYLIQSRLGAGGMGEVYLARDPRLGRDVAIKTSKAQFSERFEREARAVAALNHPNICTIHDVGSSPEVPGYIVMELVEGPTLQDRLKEGPLPLEEALAIARQIGEALEAAHEKGIVHRDLKPANIKLLPDGRVKVLDFGLAKIAEPMGAASGSSAENSPTLTLHAATEAGMILGTAAYMSPEQARGKNVDKRADIWAFGVVLYEMLSADRAFGGETVSDILAAVLTREIDLNRVPERVRPVIRACLERDPKKRLRDIGDVWRLLDAAPAKVEVVEAPRKKTALLWPIATGLAAVAAGVLAFLHFGEPAPAVPSQLRFRVALPDRVTFPTRGAMLLSPDGKHLLFPALGGDGKRGLWIHTFESLEPHAVAGIDAPQPLTIAWKPDSQAFIVVDGENRLQRVDLATSSVETITTLKGDFLGAAWTQDDTLLLGTAKGIVKMPAAGGEPQPVTQVRAGETFHFYPSMLPDGRNFVYVRFGAVESSKLAIGSLDKAPGEQSTKTLLGSPMAPVIAPGEKGPRLLYLKGEALVAQDLDVAAEALTGEPREIAPQVTIFNNLFPMVAVSRNGRLVYRPGATTYALQPTWYSRTGQVLGAVGEPNYTGILVLSPDASQALLTLQEGKENQRTVWTMNTESGARTRLTFDPAGAFQPTWSRDGKRIAYRSGQGKGSGIYLKNTNGSGGEERVLESERPANLTDWSKDGRYLVFHRNAPGTTGWDLWVLPLEGDRKPVAVAQGKGSEQGGHFSPDGRLLAYVSNETGRSEIYVQEVKLDGSGAGKWMVSQGAVGMARWRADGKELVYLAPDSRVMAVDITTSPVFRAGEPHALFQLPPSFLRTRPDAGAISDMTADGQRFLFAMPDSSAADALTVVEHWDQAGAK